MTDKERDEAIAKHGEAHEKKIVARRKARASSDERKKKRGALAFLAHLKKPK